MSGAFSSLLRPSPRATVQAAAELLAQHHAAQATTAQQIAARGMSLAQFCREAWHVVEPGTPLVWTWPLEAMCQHVEAVLLGRLTQQNLAITVPPGFAKSTIASVMAPAWALIARPWLRFICASGNPIVAVRDSLRCRQIVSAPWYRARFGVQWLLSDDQNQKTHFNTTAGGFRLALGTGSSITGTRADVLLVDDGLDAASANSAAERDSANYWFDHAFSNRLADMRRGCRILIQQRLHVEDLVGHALSVEPAAWCHLDIPQVFTPERRCVTSIWADPRTEAGQLAFPERFPQSVIDGERLRLGASGFAAQHQQQPYLEGGEVFKRDALQLWTGDLPEFIRVIVSADTAFKTTQESDYSALFVMGEFAQGIMLMDLVRSRLAYPQLKATLTELAAKWRPSAVLVEDAASGQSLIQDLKQSTTLPVLPVKPLGDKLMRAHTAVPTWEAHRVYAPASAAWLSPFLDELTAFPKAPHDDAVDAFVMGVTYMSGWGGGRGLLEHFRLEIERLKSDV